MYPFFARQVLAPVFDICRGTHTIRCLKELEVSQWWSRDKILELQNARLRLLLKQAYENVPYYRRIFDERSLKPGSIQSAEDLFKLPLLTKQLIRENQAELLASNFKSMHYLRLSTGGSTGEPLQFYRTREDQLSWGFAAAHRALGWAGYRLGDRNARISAVRPYSSKIHWLSENGKNFFERVLVIDAKKLSSRTFPLYIRKLEKYQPKFLGGYPSSIELLARYIHKAGGTRLKPAGIITGAEQLYDYQREIFTSVFGCGTFSYYSSWEAHAIAAECTAHSGYHIAAENLIVELVDDAGNPVPAGREGKVVITNLHNYAMPFIRYSIEDLATASEKACPCGRGLPLLAGISGRITDVIYTKSGKAISGTAFLHILRTPAGISQFQLVQESLDKIIIKLVMERKYSQQYLNDLAAMLSGKCKDLLEKDMEIIIEFTDVIPLHESGKRRIIISKIKPAP